MTTTLTQHKILSFDCYGTLIDWESGIWDAFQPLMLENAGSSERTGTGPDRRACLTAFGEIESEVENETPAMLYRDVLGEVHRRLAQRYSLKSSRPLDNAFGESIAHWPAFADTADALRRLKKHFRLAILSNVHREGFARSNQKLGVAFDAVYTAEEIGTYKPDIRNFEYLVRRVDEEFGLSPAEILHTAQSLYHDHAPANRIGIANVWIDRQRLSEGGDWGATRALEQRPTTTAVFFSMAELADAVERELAEA